MSIQVEVSAEARSQVRELIKTQKPGTAVRVFLQAGGGGCCSSGEGDGCGCGAEGSTGPSFGMAFDRPRNGDEVVKVDGFALVVDASTAPQLDGARIDYVQELDQTGFKIVSPQGREPSAPIGSGCGCGAGGAGCC
jgi:Fe-S cluster assembly iron-binding protein IscA